MKNTSQFTNAQDDIFTLFVLSDQQSNRISNVFVRKTKTENLDFLNSCLLLFTLFS